MGGTYTFIMPKTCEKVGTAMTLSNVFKNVDFYLHIKSDKVSSGNFKTKSQISLDHTYILVFNKSGLKVKGGK